MPGSVVPSAARSACKEAILLVQGTTASIAIRAAKPRTLPLFTSERPFLFELDDLLMTVDGDGDLSLPQTTNTQHRVIFQEPIVGPFLPTT